MKRRNNLFNNLRNQILQNVRTIRYKRIVTFPFYCSKVPSSKYTILTEIPGVQTIEIIKLQILNHYQFDQIYWTLGNFLKPLAKINLPKSPTF